MSPKELRAFTRLYSFNFFANEFSPLHYPLKTGDYVYELQVLNRFVSHLKEYICMRVYMCRYVTCMRDPLNRIVSHFNYAKTRWHDYLVHTHTYTHARSNAHAHTHTIIPTHAQSLLCTRAHLRRGCTSSPSRKAPSRLDSM